MTDHRSGFACLVGRPNVGKSTLLNALVGRSVTITANRPQTTRHTIRGIVTRTDGQLVVVDTPGLHRPRTLLGERLNDAVLSTLSQVDVVGVCLPADQRLGPGDRFLLDKVSSLRRQQVVAIVTKTDLVAPGAVVQSLAAAQTACASAGVSVAEFVPVSAVDGANVGLLADLLVGMLPPGPQLFPDGEVSDQPERTVVAELIREAALERLHDELPHSLAVDIEEMGVRPDRPEDDPLTDIYATLYVERSSQKPILLGRRGAQIREIGAQARGRIEALLGNRVYLDLHVKIAKDWQNDPAALRRLGF